MLNFLNLALFNLNSETSYIRQILFVKNTGASPQRFALTADCYTDDYGADISPIENDGRYYTP